MLCFALGIYGSHCVRITLTECNRISTPPWMLLCALIPAFPFMKPRSRWWPICSQAIRFSAFVATSAVAEEFLEGFPMFSMVKCNPEPHMLETLFGRNPAF